MVATDTIVNRRGFEPLVKPNAHCQSIEAAMPGPVHSSAEGIEPSGLGLTAKDAILPTPVCT